MGIVKDIVRQGKDRAVSMALELLVERVMGKFGKLLHLDLDSLTRSIELEILLTGEDAPVVLTILEYRFAFEGDTSFVIIGDVTVSREWMKILAEDLLKGKRFEIPLKYARLLDTLV